MDLKKSWKGVLCDGIRFGKSLTCTTLKTLKYGVQKTAEWIDSLFEEEAAAAKAVPCDACDASQTTDTEETAE